ncbi:MAG: hypothetical protein AAGM38_15520 [Pseudomonadota bacterium]
MKRRDIMRSGAGALAVVSFGGAAAVADSGFDRDRRADLPDALRLRFSLPSGGRFFPRRLILIGPRAAAAAALPERAAPQRENRAPVARLPAIGAAFEARPYLDRIDVETRIGGVFRGGEDDLIAAIDRHDAFEAALAGARSDFGMITRAPRSRRLISFSPSLSFAPIARGDAVSGALAERIGAAHLAGGALVLAPPQNQLPRFNLF